MKCLYQSNMSDMFYQTEKNILAIPRGRRWLTISTLTAKSFWHDFEDRIRLGLDKVILYLMLKNTKLFAGGLRKLTSFWIYFLRFLIFHAITAALFFTRKQDKSGD